VDQGTMTLTESIQKSGPESTGLLSDSNKSKKRKRKVGKVVWSNYIVV
jgi:hypothetical protein